MNNMKTVYRVYCTCDGEYLAKDFGAGELTASLTFMEGLRKARKDGAKIEFITMVSENPDCTSLAGAAGVDPEDYEWKKRRTQ